MDKGLMLLALKGAKGKPPAKGASAPAPAEPEDDGLLSAADDLIAAVEGGDRVAVADALDAAYAICAGRSAKEG